MILSYYLLSTVHIQLPMTQSKQPAMLQAPVTELAGRITTIIETARKRIQSVVDHEMVRAYWEIGREIVED